MQLLATAEQMQAFDRTAIRKYGISGLTMMENAGRGVVEALENRRGSLRSSHVYVLCGKGNNGGDGFVIARHLLNKGAIVRVLLLGRSKDVKGDARTNLKILLRLVRENEERIHFEEVTSPGKLVRMKKPDIIIDAIFGTGFSREITGLYRSVISWINRSASFVAAVDIPSGVNATTGVVSTIAVQSSLTVTMALAKIGHYVGQGRDHSGDVAIADLGIPRGVFRLSRDQVYRVNSADVREMLPHRSLSAHKHSVGKVFVLSGSRGLTGAPYMCAQAAMKAGAGAVILGVPRSLHMLMARKVTEVMVTPLDETEEGTVARSALSAIQEKIGWSDVVVLGPGLSRNFETQQLLLDLIKSIRKPLVLDADALNAVAMDKQVLNRRERPAILTPHVGELSRIIGESGTTVERLRVTVAQKFSKKLGCVLVLKGAPTVTSIPTGVAYLNSSGNPGMATAGSGDVLTGLIAGLLGQGMTAHDAAVAGVFVHGLAGDVACSKVGQKSMLALDILDSVPRAFGVIEGRWAI